MDNRIERIKPGSAENILKSNNMNQWLKIASETPLPKKLCGDLFVEGETVFLFADANVGKSLFAYQIAESIASGKPISDALPVETEPQKVLLFDFEMSIKHLEKRYSGYTFSSNFIRYQLDRDAFITDDLEKVIYKEIESVIISTRAKVGIIDNITYIKSHAEKTDEAAKFMREINQLRAKLNLSVLVLTHTPKRDMKQPISENDMIGSKNLTNAADASFTIGRSSKGQNIRYIKQTKCRLGEHVYHAGNVLDCEIIQRDDHFTGFQLNGYSPEFSHLKRVTETDKRDSEIYELKQQGLTYKQIAEQLNIHENTVKNSVKRHREQENEFEEMPF
jgi:DNA-binding transcriptional regulator YiaG